MTVKRVVIIEDNSNQLIILKTILETKIPNWEIKTSSTGEEGILLINAYKPDLILLDRCLPDISGDTICEYVRTKINEYDPYICMLTGLISTQSKIQGYKIGIDDYICKPIDYEELPIRLALMSTRGHRDLPVSRNQFDLEIQTKYLRILPNGRVYINLPDEEEKETYLTETELRLFKLLIQSAGRFVNRRDIGLHLWGACCSYSVVSTNIHRIKKKLGAANILIESNRHLGYSYNDNAFIKDDAHIRHLA
ncbi:response regulator transcription factor [Okeania sp. KiyG1]|uniref:response regulator transcription factor n=1 Tax=Okeania sp. KiyG1 TaxID=2720165 RepID=UPI00192105FC|nr:response regulator transcription factor [Okeania sp. KiyG1]GGA57267.1 DNA-binding response regulator [Okeania sp. KiyG1]